MGRCRGEEDKDRRRARENVPICPDSGQEDPKLARKG